MAHSFRPFGATHHIACVMHWCDRCQHPILPGDYYERYVERRKDKILVWKYHQNPDCPPDPFDWDDGEDTDELVAINDNSKEHSNERAA